MKIKNFDFFYSDGDEHTKKQSKRKSLERKNPFNPSNKRKKKNKSAE